VRGPNCDSDHYLVKVKIKDKRATIDNNKSYKRKKWKVDKLKEPEQSQLYQKILKTKLEALRTELTENENEQVEQQWNIIKQAVIEAATETISDEERMRNEWYNKECREAMQEKNMDISHMLQRTRQTYDKYKESRKKANKIIHSKKESSSQKRNRKY
jgi:hypothetical protein